MKTILITGGTDGIGKATALQLARQGDNLTIVGRDVPKGEQAAAEIAQATGANVRFVSVDMSLMTQVERFADTYLAEQLQLDILVHSAGVMMANRVLTAEGFEMTFATQYLSRALLTDRLLPALVAAGAGKVLFVSSGRAGNGNLDYANLHGERRYGAVAALLTSSQALSLYVADVMQRHPEVQVYNYGPGLVQTSLGRSMPAGMNLFVRTVGRLLSISPERVGREITRLLSGAYPSGFYLRGIKPNTPAKGLPDPADRRTLRQVSDRLIHAAAHQGQHA